MIFHAAPSVPYLNNESNFHHGVTEGTEVHGANFEKLNRIIQLLKS